jgi:hypothetical protein
MQPFATHRHFKDENAGSLNQAHGAIQSSRRLPTLLGELEDPGNPEFAGRRAMWGPARTGDMLLSECPFSAVLRDTKA